MREHHTVCINVCVASSAQAVLKTENYNVVHVFVQVEAAKHFVFHSSSRLLNTKQCTPSLTTQRKDPFLLHLLSNLMCSIRVCEVQDSSSLLHWAIPVYVALQQHASMDRGTVKHIYCAKLNERALMHELVCT